MDSEEFNDRIYDFLAQNLTLVEETTFGAYSSNRKLILKLYKPDSYNATIIGEISFDNPEGKVIGYWDED